MKLWIADNGWQCLYVTAHSRFRAEFIARRRFEDDGMPTKWDICLTLVMDLSCQREQTTKPMDIHEFSNILDRS